MKQLARGIWVATSLALLSTAALADEVAKAPMHFVVEPQTLREALIQWAQQAELSVIWPAGQKEAALAVLCRP